MREFNNIAKLTQFYDVQPYLSITLGSTNYSSIGNQPRFLAISNFNQSNQGGLDYSVSMDVTLSDHDGAMKTLLDSGTLLDLPVTIIQEFDDITTQDTLFSGKVTTPITWNEADRTIQFTVENGAQDVMLNDEDPVDDCEQEFIPFCFGDVLGVKAVNSAGGCKKISKLLKPITHSCINSQSGKISYASGDLYIKNGLEIFGSNRLILMVEDTLFDGAFSDANDHTHFVLVTGGFNCAFRTGGLDINPRDTTDVQDETNASVAWVTEEAYDVRGKMARIQFQTEYWYTVNSDGSRSPTTENDASGTKTTETVTTAIGISGIEGTKMALERPPLDRFGRPVLLGWKKSSSILEIKGKMDYSWNPAPTYDYPNRWEIPSGSEVIAYNGANTWYVNHGSSQAIVAVYGMKNGLLTKIPSTWYTTDLSGPTSITFDMNLAAKGGFDNNDVYVDLTSWANSQNIASVISWLATNYCTGLTVDNETFLVASTAVGTLPCGFAITNKIRSFDLMKELAYQGGLGLQIIDGVLYFKDITKVTGNIQPHQPYVVSADKTEFRSCSITTTNETDVITHFIGTYRESYYPQDEEHRIVRVSSLKDKFKKNEKTYDFFAFNQKDCVIRVMEFYLNRYINIWQQLNIKTFLTSLHLNPFDIVSINLGYSKASYGIITNVDYNPIDWSVQLLIETDKGIFPGSYWGTLVGTTPGSIFTDNDIALDSVFEEYARAPIVELLPTKFFYDADPAKINPVDTSNINTTRDSALNLGKIKTIAPDYLVVDLVDPNDTSKTLNLNNFSSVNEFPSSQIKAVTDIPVSKAPNLKQSSWDGKTFSIQGKNITYNKINDYSRYATDGTTTETQAETPPYYVGEIIQLDFIGRGAGTKDANGDPIYWIDKKSREFAKVAIV